MRQDRIFRLERAVEEGSVEAVHRQRPLQQELLKNHTQTQTVHVLLGTQARGGSEGDETGKQGRREAGQLEKTMVEYIH